jgi:hypothetical protein
MQKNSCLCSTVALGLGSSLKKLKKHVEKETAGLIISRSTINRLFVPSRKGTINAARYRSLVNDRVAVKRNYLQKGRVDAHADAAMVRSSMEVAAHFPDLIDEISADDKAKVKVGILAVCKYHQLHKLCPEHC